MFLSSFASAYQYEVSILAIFKDEADYLDEWIEYHHSIGVDHFVLYNHNSSDDFMCVIEKHVNSGLVELRHWQPIEFPKAQLDAYREGIKSQKGVTKWLAVIDIDEFILPRKHKNIKKFLKKYEVYAGIVINWQIFGTSGIQSLEPGSWITQHLKLRFPSNYHNSKYNISNRFVKSIIRPDYIDETSKDIQCGNHVFMPINGKSLVNADFTKVLPLCEYPYVLSDKIVINHYFARTIDWLYKKKVDRRRMAGDNMLDDKIKYIIENGNDIFDDEITKYPIIANHEG